MHHLLSLLAAPGLMFGVLGVMIGPALVARSRGWGDDDRS